MFTKYKGTIYVTCNVDKNYHELGMNKIMLDF